MRHFTILNAGSKQFLISADSDFVEVEQELSTYWFDNKSFWQIIHDRNKDYSTLICLLIELDVISDDKELENFYKNEKNFPELWIAMVNKILPKAKIILESFSPMGW